MEILRQIRNQDWEWVDFIDQMTPEEEKEYYEREIVSINEKMKSLFQDMKWIEELIANWFEAIGDAEIALALRTQLEELATRRKEILNSL